MFFFFYDVKIKIKNLNFFLVAKRIVVQKLIFENKLCGIELVHFSDTWFTPQVIMTCVPFTFTVYILDSWPFGLALCKVSECAKDISIGVSVFTLTALSADRFFAIVDPMRKFHTTGTSFDFPFSCP